MTSKEYSASVNWLTNQISMAKNEYNVYNDIIKCHRGTSETYRLRQDAYAEWQDCVKALEQLRKEEIE